ncbi:hypothetical protein B0H16DRAFT_1741728 [Mycena metata]|uniref:PUM-HD domain-containing protein n=1 Tax=Mycena metata TaxID=1033252 RepID=A0AAD7MFZ6_9AGAR|nr:hypothetical protein B0H16DRAFT_1741728 [Mycena metata]
MDANDAFTAQVAGPEERGRIVDAICARGGEMIMHLWFSNWAVQHCLEAATGPEERRQIVACVRGRTVDLAINCYGYHVLQKDLDCIPDCARAASGRSGDDADHVAFVDPTGAADLRVSFNDKWAVLAYHETGSLVNAFENPEERAEDVIVDELLDRASRYSSSLRRASGAPTASSTVRSSISSAKTPIPIIIDTVIEYGSEKYRQMALEHPLTGLLEFAMNEQGSKTVVKALKEGGKETLDRVVQYMCEPANGARRAIIVDLAASALTGSQLIAPILPTADKDQSAALCDCIHGHIVTLRGSKVIWLLYVDPMQFLLYPLPCVFLSSDRMRAYYEF